MVKHAKQYITDLYTYGLKVSNVQRNDKHQIQCLVIICVHTMPNGINYIHAHRELHLK